MHHKRRRARNQRGAKMLKFNPHKVSGTARTTRYKGLRAPRRIANIEQGE